ncbi:hypothetical protein [Stenotrophomonas sp. AN71]|uniref:hypothetical protein n=1 Tax=Stenotrophomonas sp. AN71 TaxID=3156253 RepID=UPI003D1DCBCC
MALLQIRHLPGGYAVHLANIAIHVMAGAAALAAGFLILFKEKGTATHKRLGMTFVWLSLVVCATAIIGTIFFRFIPVFAVLSLLVPYQLLGGWRVARTQGAGPAMIDGVALVVAMAIALPLSMEILAGPGRLATVDYAAVVTLWMVLAYDAIKWTFPRRWHASLWRYEHIYKMIASVFAMLSALTGNVVRVGQPWSQMLPSAMGVVVIAYFCQRLARERRTPGVNLRSVDASPRDAE